MNCASIRTASSPFDDTDRRCVRGGRRAGFDRARSDLEHPMVLPDGAELKTIVSPPGMKRALKMDWGSNVFMVNVIGGVASPPTSVR